MNSSPDKAKVIEKDVNVCDKETIVTSVELKDIPIPDDYIILDEDFEDYEVFIILNFAWLDIHLDIDNGSYVDYHKSILRFT